MPVPMFSVNNGFNGTKIADKNKTGQEISMSGSALF
jgi:hypothetical protein